MSQQYFSNNLEEQLMGMSRNIWLYEQLGCHRNSNIAQLGEIADDVNGAPTDFATNSMNSKSYNIMWFPSNFQKLVRTIQLVSNISFIVDEYYFYIYYIYIFIMLFPVEQQISVWN